MKPNRRAAAVMRFNAVHHTLAVFQGDEPGLCHMLGPEALRNRRRDGRS
jgi:hypothetical protein